MHRFSFIGKVLLSLFLLISALDAIELNWEHNYQNALAKAKKEHKMVYLFVGADKCRHCDRFKKQTLSNKELIETMKKEYVLLYMSRDRHEIPDKFEKYGVPMHYFLTADGKIVAVVQGSRELAGWYDVLDEVELKKEK
ncbi:thioredoxin [Sulfurovum lithotrophicum]|uniref:Thioredoxin n=1 Tax=Sulfurovum lithotrophicum TaxID=206403 RepID=A0A7U4RRF1_9BACT|nr:thioredoxin family protein [Sulfurovum lithotrophicum]AKF25747.1 thioredoxin [Sulfurovum lithotrophicum]